MDQIDRNRYYEGGISSVYFWDIENEGFAGVVLLKKCVLVSEQRALNEWSWLTIYPKAVQPQSKTEGAWDSIHVFEALDRARNAHYKLTSTVILNMVNNNEAIGEMDLSGNMTRQVNRMIRYERG